MRSRCERHLEAILEILLAAEVATRAVLLACVRTIGEQLRCLAGHLLLVEARDVERLPG
jgi:hypothetical protein